MNRLLALALVAPALLLPGCGGPLVSAEVKNARITSTDIPFAGSGVPGDTSLGVISADMGPLGDSLGDGVVTEIKLKRVAIAWTDPSTRPDFSGVTSATLTASAPGGAPTVLATYVQDPTDPNPEAIVIAGDPSINLFDLLADGVLDMQLDAQGALPATPWLQTATVVADLSVKIEYTP